MTQYIKQLPAIFQTVTEKKFFDATFDQLLSKKDSDLLAGYLGRRSPGNFEPVTDFFIPEQTKNRTWWQLEPTSYAEDVAGNKTNVLFYEDLLDNIKYYGGNTLNQDRLFESPYYSWAPPIDVDMFINYQNYYWVENGLTPISITGVSSSDIIGRPEFNTNSIPGATPQNLLLTTGITIILEGDPIYSTPHTVENIGGCVGIRLVKHFPDYTPGTTYEFLPWDGIIQLSTGAIIDNTHWDTKTWDSRTQPTTGDYITIERGSVDRNAWSRTNKWVNIDAINATIEFTQTPFPEQATRALRPIIQFVADLQLYKSGSQFREEINYGYRNNDIGSPLLMSMFAGKQVSDVNIQLTADFVGGEIVCFFNDASMFNLWDYTAWDIPPEAWDAGFSTINKFLFKTHISSSGVLSFIPHTSWTTPLIDGDIVFVTEDGPFDAAKRGQTWYYSNNVWQEAYNDKISANQPPLFQLFDHNGIRLDDEVTYPHSTFAGNKIFSYKVNTTSTAIDDVVLKFPIVYTALGQASDIVFQNNIVIDQCVYQENRLAIDGYYYYKTTTSPVLYNNWNLCQSFTCTTIVSGPVATASKQRVIDTYVVGYGSKHQFKLSTVPLNYIYGGGAIQPAADISVSINGTEIFNSSLSSGFTFTEINGEIYVNLDRYITLLDVYTLSKVPVVELQTYTHHTLQDDATGYFSIPQQLEANPTQLEVYEISGSEVTQHFTSIIKNQIGEIGIPFGGNTNYRDTLKNRSLGTYIIQNISPALKSMLVSSSQDLDIISSIRFSQHEYTKFKNKYLKISLQLINQSFNPLQYHTNSVVISSWVDEVLKTLTITNEFSDAFAYSYMIASGSPLANELHTLSVSKHITMANSVDIDDARNTIYVYDITTKEQLLVVGRDYTISSSLTGGMIDIHFTSTVAVNTSVAIALYNNPPPAYIPSTPSKLGLYPTYIPRLEWDTTYVKPTWVIIGHDGSKTIAYNDYRDQLLLELEIRIYNSINRKFVNQYRLPIRIENVRSGFFRHTRYSAKEYLQISMSYLNKWATTARANYRANDWEITSLDASVVPSFTPGSGNIWKLYNYKFAIESESGKALNLPGNWKGIYQFYYDTIHPDTRPWEMLGFSIQPSWWIMQYGPGVHNSAGQIVWPNSVAYASMWSDIENGIIRQGSAALYDPVTLLPRAHDEWKRPGLSVVIPVDVNGELISIMTLFNVAFSGNYYKPFEQFDADWVYGDGAPVEQAWMASSSYAFSMQEVLFLMRPGPYGELCWDTLGTGMSPGTASVLGVEPSTQTTINYQYVQNDLYKSELPYHAWTRPKNSHQQVHAETVDGIIQLRSGYQTWISDRILFLGKDITSTFGHKIRTLNVNLANKVGGFTNKDTTKLYIESVSPMSTSTGSLAIPSTNFQCMLHKSPVVKTYSYSGVIIRALADGMFAVYGYDLLNSEFITLDRSDDIMIDITVGGVPAEFETYTKGQTYAAGDIVRYNGVYYISRLTQTVSNFDSTNWTKINTLPVVGGVSVNYKPGSLTTTTRVPYGTILPNVQSVFDMLIGWGAYLESQGWVFDDVSSETNMLNDWLYSGKQFLFWLNTNWAPNASIQLSPLSNIAKLVVSRGYPSDVESMSNGVYSILDKTGVAILPRNTITDRNGRFISIAPIDTTSGIYYLQVNTTEIEHVITIDNTTSFNDVVYSPLLRSRQTRIRFNGFRSNGWYGKMEAPGYLVVDNQLIPNFDTIVDSMRHFYDPNIILDNPSIEDLGHHLIGYESKSYLDNLQVSNDVQYMFYQGAIRQKGTVQSFNKLFRSNKAQSNETIQVFEEWAIRLGTFGNTVEQVSTEFILQPEQNSGEVIVARLNYTPSTIGFVKSINILNAENIYKTPPKILVYSPDATPDTAWSIFDTTVAYTKGDLVRYTDKFNNIAYYTSKIDQVPGNFNTTHWTLVLETRVAKAYAVLDLIGRISRIDITDSGAGYLSAPYVSIIPDTATLIVDKVYSVWQGDIIRDEILDNIVDIDIDQPEKWLVRPANPSQSLVFPTTTNINYALPNAGFVHFDDVNWTSFNVEQTAINWGSVELNPKEFDTIWVADNFVKDWSVYKLSKFYEDWKLVKDDNNDILLITTKFRETTLEVSTAYNSLGRGAVLLPIIDNGRIVSVNVVQSGNDYILSDTIIAKRAVAPNSVYVDVQLTIDSISDTGEILSVLVGNPLHNSGYEIVPNVSIIPEQWLDDTTSTTTKTDFGNMIVLQQLGRGKIPIMSANYTVGITPYTGHDYTTPGVYTDPDTLIEYNAYHLSTLSGTPITTTEISNYTDFTELLLFKTLRWYNKPAEPRLPSYVGIGDFIWVDDIDGKWAVFNIQADPGVWDVSGWNPTIIDFWSPNYGWDVSGPLYFNPHRIQEPLINTSLFESASVFSTNSKDEIVRLPIYDPFKDILPGPARQNISYITSRDPASYNVTPDQALFSNNITFANKQTGQLWWDTSSTRYVYYEQPVSLNGEETPISNLAYRRNHWGQLFPGSRIMIYEWVQSLTPPALYSGSGTPRDIRTYVQVTTSNRITNVPETMYYFWVANTTELSGAANRTMVAKDVSNMLQAPKSQGFAFFSPIHRTLTNNSYMFYNVQEILAYQGNNIQIQYRLTERADQTHTQWSFFREGDSNSLISDHLWDKLVDSLCGYTRIMDQQYGHNGIIIAEHLPWDIYGWDITNYDSATLSTTPKFGIVMPVPDPSLSEEEKYGIEYRPRQGMFKHLLSARKVFIQSSNAILQQIAIRDKNPSWDSAVKTDTYWTYTNWYASGYSGVTPTIVFRTLQDANNAVTQRLISVGDIVEVTSGTPDGRFILYVVEQLNTSVDILSLKEVCIEKSAIKLLDTVYTTGNLYSLSVELRQLLNAFRTQVLVNHLLVNQNKLFFSMLNYVMSEQQTPDWIFKTSYIYIKENNIPLSQSKLFAPDQIDNVIQYIKDTKPYHTHVRDYTSTHTNADVYNGAAADTYKWSIALSFGPGFPGSTYTPTQNILDARTLTDNITQFVSREDVYTVNLTRFDSSKQGLSQLFPYTFNFDSININNPQSVVSPYNIVGVRIGDTTLTYGRDYYVEYNIDSTYTVYFYNDPSGIHVPEAIIWFDGGSLLTMNTDTYKDETYKGTASDMLVVNVDTKLPVNIDTNGVYSAISDMWDYTDATINSIIQDHGGQPAGFGTGFWDQDTTTYIHILDNTISSKETTNTDSGATFYRNADAYAGTLVHAVSTPTLASENLDVITVYVDPVTHSTTNIFPIPNARPGVIWIDGERIEYRMLTELSPNTWELSLVRRGTLGTAPAAHTTLSRVWVEQGNKMLSTGKVHAWNAVNNLPNLSTETSAGSAKYTNMTSMPLGGLWYAQTPEAMFLKHSPGTATV